MSSFQVHSIRGATVESVHHISVVVVDAEGRIRASAGNPDFLTYIRSAAKPFQAIPIVTDGAVSRYEVSPQELALACASHNSERRQVDRVRVWLERIDLSEDDLACGPHRPLGLDLAVGPSDRSEVDGTDLVTPSPVANNCSGKHTGMLTLARAQDWPVEGYHERDHPVQQRVRTEMAQFAGLSPDELDDGIDGCGVVAFSLPLRAMARAYARLAVDTAAPVRAVVGAMAAHPELVAGEGRLDTALMRALPGRVISKVGAEGVYGVSLLDRGMGLALKVEDGNARAAVVALTAVLRALGVITGSPATLAPYELLPILNTRGATVGRMEATGVIQQD